MLFCKFNRMVVNGKGRKKPLFAGISLCLLIMGCQVGFNFTGVPKGSITSNISTISIELFGNQAPIIVPELAQVLTEQLQEQFIAQSRLTLTTGEADVIVSGTINNYSITPVAITGDERAAQNRLTISVKVDYNNQVNEEESWSQSFSRFIDFDAVDDFASMEEELYLEVNEQLIQDIFTKSLGDW